MFPRKTLATARIVAAAVTIISAPWTLAAQTSALSKVSSPTAETRSAITPGHIRTTAMPAVRITAKVDDSKRTTLKGHVSSALRHASDMGRVKGSTPASQLVMVLKSSDEQRSELHRILDEQQDKNSPNYHQWVTPEQFGEHFGVHDADIAKVNAWLQSQGLTVDSVSKSKRVITFSGNVSQIERAFGTEIHNYSLAGENHVANNSNITVPDALHSVISGVTLNNFFRKGHMGPVSRLKTVKAQAEPSTPLYGNSSSSTHYVGPWDFATIYNTFPLLNKGITGAGTSIAVVGRSDILLSDVQSYRALFDLPSNDPIFIHAGQDNGTQAGDDGESDLDVEISGGIAPASQLYFVIGTPTFFVDGITNSVEYIVENNTADIMSISYGSCESVEGAGGNEFNNQAFEQAAAQGISVFVASGDNGPAECDNSNSTYEVYGYSTGGESSTPYNVSVGGTQGYEANSYWATSTQLTAPYWGLSALSYVPEVPWNESRVANKSLDASGSLGGLWSGSGGISSYYMQPAWQRGSGISTTADPAYAGGNWVTGISLTNGGGSGYTTAPAVTFTGGGCLAQPTATSILSGGSVTGIAFTYFNAAGTEKTGQGFGCTSVPTVSFAAAPSGGTTATATATIGPMVNIAPLVAGVPHRLTPDLSLNAASGHDATLFCSEGSCQWTTSGATTTLVDAGLVGGTSVAAPSMAGIQALINQANGGRQGMPGYIYYALANAQSATSCNSTLGNTIGTGCAFQDITQGDNLICGVAGSGCSVALSATSKMGWTAGTGYDLATGLGSVNASNLATQWKNVVFNSSSTTLNINQAGEVIRSGSASFPQGSALTLRGVVKAGSGTGTPSGDVAFILSQGAIGQTLDVSGDANTGAFNGQTAFATLGSDGSYSATLSSLPAGSYTVTARYAGDGTFASSLSTPVPVSVSPGNDTVTISTGNINVSSCTLFTPAVLSYGSPAYFTVNVASSTGSGVPTGTLTLAVDGTTWGTIPLDPNGNGYLIAGNYNTTASCLFDYIFSQGAFLTGGTHTISASYSGDGTFAAATATPVTVTVSPITPSMTLSSGAQTITSGFSVPFVSTFTVSSLTSISPIQASGPTGTVTYTDTTTGVTLGTATVVPTSALSNLSTSTAYPSYTYGAVANGSTTSITQAGANAVTATYSGDANYNPVTSAATTVTVGTATATTTTTVTSSANPTTLGGRPTFTATIGIGTGTAPTTGTVTFYDGATLLGTGTVGTAHTATFRPAATYALTGGAHTITAVYGGVATAGPSTSAPFTETVTKTTGTITMSVKTAGLVGQTFAFAAVLPAQVSAVYTPTLGSVQFLDNGTVIGSGVPFTIAAELGGYGIWEATYSATSLAAGTHSITATYSDANYTYTSAVTTVKVYSNPFGTLELAVDGYTSSPSISGSDPLYLSGWVVDPVDGTPVTNTKVYIDGVLVGTPTLGVSRPDVASKFSNQAYSTAGFTMATSASSLSAGTHAVTVVTTDSYGLTTTLGPLSISYTPVYAPPTGNLDQAVDSATSSTTVAQSDSLYVSGWAADPLDGSPLSNVKVYLDGTLLGSATTGISRPDVATSTGNANYTNSGFTFVAAANGSAFTIGTHSVTAVVTNSHGVSTTLGPVTITVTGGTKPPAGHLDIAVDGYTGSTPVAVADPTYVQGWAADYQADGPVKSVVIYVDGVAVTGTAVLNQGRPDVASSYNDPNWANVGWYFVIPGGTVSAGTHSVTAVATDSKGLTTTLGPASVLYQ